MRLFLLLCLFYSCSIVSSDRKLEWADDDTVIIEATRDNETPNLIFERNDENPLSKAGQQEKERPDFRYGPPIIRARRALEPITCYSTHGDEGLCSTFQDCYPMVFYKDAEHMNEIKHPILAAQLKTNAGPCIPPPMSFRDDFVPGGGYYQDSSSSDLSLADLICCPSMKTAHLDFLKEQRTTIPTTTTTRRTTTTTKRPSYNEDDDLDDDFYSDPAPDAAAMMNFYDTNSSPQPKPIPISKKGAKKPPKKDKPKPYAEEVVVIKEVVPPSVVPSTAPERVVKTEEQQQQQIVTDSGEIVNVVPVSVKTQASSEEADKTNEVVPLQHGEGPIDIPVPPPVPVYPELQQDCGVLKSSFDPPQPWVVAIQLDQKYMCAGSIIDNYHVLTAAHCVAHLSSVDIGRMRVYLGERVLNSNVDGPTVIRRVSRAMRHRGYSISTLQNDIAILKLNLPIPINTNRVKPICLSKYDANDATVASIVGWGTQWNEVENDRLIENQFRIWPNGMCAEKYKTLAPDINISDDMLCAQYYHVTSRNPQRTVSIYDVDSAGSPLIVRSPNGRYEQIGINSWRIRTNSTFPFVLTRVTAFPQWIAKNCARP